MKHIFKVCFSENRTVSSMRVMASYAVVTASILGLIGLLKGSDLYGLTALVGVFVGSAFGGKVLQKKEEAKNVTAE